MYKYVHIDKKIVYTESGVGDQRPGDINIMTSSTAMSVEVSCSKQEADELRCVNNGLCFVTVTNSLSNRTIGCRYINVVILSYVL